MTDPRSPSEFEIGLDIIDTTGVIPESTIHEIEECLAPKHGRAKAARFAKVLRERKTRPVGRPEGTSATDTARAERHARGVIQYWKRRGEPGWNTNKRKNEVVRLFANDDAEEARILRLLCDGKGNSKEIWALARRIVEDEKIPLPNFSREELKSETTYLQPFKHHGA